MKSKIVQAETKANSISVYNPFDGSLLTTVPAFSENDVPKIINRALRGAAIASHLSRAERSKILLDVANMVDKNKEDFACTIAAEAGKTISQARKEVLRCVNTLQLSAEEAKRNAGEVIPFDSFVGSESRQGWFTREPLGIILAITPYNDPLNLVAHKLGPALAGGNAVILKPSELTPLSAIKLVDMFYEAGLPQNVVTVAPGDVEFSKALVSCKEIRMISFTGGFKTAEEITKIAGLKKMSMDLGGNAPVIVMDDCDLISTVDSCVSGSFWAAGQNCIGTQRLLIHHEIYDEFKSLFVRKTKALVVGNPSLADTDVGPLISETAAERVEGIVNEAINEGAVLLTGNNRVCSIYEPTVLENVSQKSKLWIEEAFSPVVILEKFYSVDEAIQFANSVEFSLHAGIFTNNLHVALTAANSIEAGGVMINDSSDYRFDAMPFGGFKYGSMGREGVRFAYEEMTQPRVICLNNIL